MSKAGALHAFDAKTDDRIKVELHELQEESPIERRYRGTDADHHDMVVLGRKQVLRVRLSTQSCGSKVLTHP